MVARIDAAIVLQRDTFAAELVIDAKLRRQSHVLRHKGLKVIDQNLAKVLAAPLVEHSG